MIPVEMGLGLPLSSVRTKRDGLNIQSQYAPFATCFVPLVVSRINRPATRVEGVYVFEYISSGYRLDISS
jgi:hypothetical protein